MSQNFVYQKGMMGKGFSPARDPAHNIGQVVSAVGLKIHRREWAPAHDLVEAAGLGGAEIAAGFAALAKIFELWMADKLKSLPDLVAESGFTSQPKEVQVMLMGYIGLVYFGISYAGIREVARPADEVGELAAMIVREAADAFAAFSPKENWFRRQLSAVRRAVTA